jgi:NTE family protein
MNRIDRRPTPLPQVGLVLTGGGARAAYQVGVLKAITGIWREFSAPTINPFPIIDSTAGFRVLRGDLHHGIQ